MELKSPAIYEFPEIIAVSESSSEAHYYSNTSRHHSPGLSNTLQREMELLRTSGAHGIKAVVFADRIVIIQNCFKYANF